MACIRYIPNFLKTADALLAWALQTPSWKREVMHMYGRRIQLPRTTAWYGEQGVGYRYSGIDHLAQGWHEALEPALADLAGLDLRPNFVLLNRYDCGAQYMGWHRDNEPSMGAWVASISLGGVRKFKIRHSAQTTNLSLEHGSLLIMPGHLEHALPKTKLAVAPRINLSFRQVNTPTAMHSGTSSNP